jgi:hypothetical protein
MGATTKIAVAQKACALMGIQPITAFTDDTSEATVLNAIYDEIVESELSGYPWRFAMAQRTLNRLASAPVSRWDAAYQIPSDILMVRAVTVNDDPIQFDRYDDNIYCNAGAAETVVLDGTYRVLEIDWPAFFRLGIEYRLASTLASGVSMQADMAQLLEQKADMQLRKARNIDASSQTTRKVNQNRLVNVRM